MKQWKVCLECGAISGPEVTECTNCCFEDFCVCDTWEDTQEASEELREDCYE